jgi:hypothetical protein
MDDKSDLTIRINRDAVGELYRMVQWWCHDQSNTFHYIKRAIEERYPATAEWNKVEFGFDKGQYGQRKHKDNGTASED